MEFADFSFPDLSINSKANFLVIGDAHLNSTTPHSRIDDYPNTILDKLSQVRLFMVSHNIPYLFLLGDVFHKPRQPVSYLSRVIQTFLSFKQSGIRVFSIVGNHDLYNDNLQTLSSTSLGVLFYTVVEPFNSISFSDYSVIADNYPNPLPTSGDILLAHRFYNSPLGTQVDNIPKNTLKFKFAFLGHDHMPYDPVVDSGCIIYRPGSFSRGTAHKYNINRSIYAYHFLDGSATRIDIPHLPTNKVFSINVTSKVQSSLLDKFQQQINSLVSNIYTKQESKLDIYSLLDSTELEPVVKSRIEQYLQQVGVFRI